MRPPSIAALAASSISRGPSVSGKPWPRLIAPVRAARADISAKIVVPKGCMREISGELMATNLPSRYAVTRVPGPRTCRSRQQGSRGGYPDRRR